MLPRSAKSKVFDFEDYVNRHDYVGALTVLEQGQNDQLNAVDRLLWIAYCSMRLCDYERTKKACEVLLSGEEYEDVPGDVGLYLAIAHYSLGSFDKAEKAAMSVSNDSELKNRILLEIARATDDETKMATYRQQLSDSKEDELAAAAIELYRCRFKETADLYEKMLTDSEEDLALNVYLAICYFKMDCFDLSLEALDLYSRAFPDSTLAANIKACNVFRLCEDGKAALEVIEAHCNGNSNKENSLIAHNAVVFQDGQTALKVWPGLVGKVPEARLNLAIYFLRQGETEAAAELLDGVDASCPQSHALLGLLHANDSRSPEALDRAQMHFERVGYSPFECDTVLGRQCMASSLILQKKFEEALVYLGMFMPRLSFIP
jgi:intraflagellar transport protein 56